MEINLLTRDGISEESILSIRAGAVKRQATVTSGRPFRFPKLSMEDNPLRIAILQQVGTAYLVLKPNDDQYRVQFDNGMSCEVEVNKIEGGEENAKQAEQPEKKETAASATEAKEYLERHQVLQFVQAVLQAVIKERPKDPYNYMARHFTSGYAGGDIRSAKKQVDVPSGEVAKQETPCEDRATAEAAPAKASAQVDAPSGEVAKQDILREGQAAVDTTSEKANASAGEAPKQEVAAAAAGHEVLASPVEAPKQDPPATAVTNKAREPAVDGAKKVEAAVVKTSEPKLEGLRLQLQDTLVHACQVGSLLPSLEFACSDPLAEAPQELELRSRTRDALLKATLDGSLDTVIQSVLQEAAPEKWELRQRARDALQKASQVGSLQSAVRSAFPDG